MTPSQLHAWARNDPTGGHDDAHAQHDDSHTQAEWSKRLTLPSNTVHEDVMKKMWHAALDGRDLYFEGDTETAIKNLTHVSETCKAFALRWRELETFARSLSAAAWKGDMEGIETSYTNVRQQCISCHAFLAVTGREFLNPMPWNTDDE